MADYVAHAVYGLYENGDASLIRPILGRFDQRGGTLHGLVHVTPEWQTCGCPACTSRREPGHFGSWGAAAAPDF